MLRNTDNEIILNFHYQLINIIFYERFLLVYVSKAEDEKPIVETNRKKLSDKKVTKCKKNTTMKNQRIAR